MERFDEIADDISSIEHRVSDLIFEAVRSQMRDDESDAAKELERRLAKVRRSLQKAEMLLRGASDD